MLFGEDGSNMIHKRKEFKISVSDVVIIKGDGERKGNWKIAIVKELSRGRDKKIRDLKINAAKSFILSSYFCCWAM